MVADFANGDARTRAFHPGNGRAQRRSSRRQDVAVTPRDHRAVHLAKNPCSTTKTAKSTTTSSLPCTNPCATATPTPPSTGWPACWRPGRTLCISPGAWSALPARMWAWPTAGALELAVAAYQACHFIGMPECSVHLTQAVDLPLPRTQIQRALRGV